ncbi:hypothetical protein HK102_001187, partial [Quaeritorhiza haematococci]
MDSASPTEAILSETITAIVNATLAAASDVPVASVAAPADPLPSVVVEVISPIPTSIPSTLAAPVKPFYLIPTLFALFYTVQVLATGTSFLISQIPKPRGGRFSPSHAFLFAFADTIVTEFSLMFLGFKFAVVYLMWGLGWGRELVPLFETVVDWVYVLDVAVFLGYWALFLQSYYSRWIVDEQTRGIKTAEHGLPPPLTSMSFWLRFMNPWWSARNVKVIPDIVYATREELEKAGPGAEEWMSLDVYHHPSYAQNRPVLVYVHGGFWASGDKKVNTPLLSYLALKKYVVVSVNHRLAPYVQYPEHLIDVKRAIRWVRGNISLYGGDPNSVFIAGGNSGGHLAAMVALTPNDPYYQPNFENVDTSVLGCISINACYDLTNYRRWFIYRIQDYFGGYVAGYTKGGKQGSSEDNEEFLKLSSPLMLLKQLEAEKRKSLAALQGARVAMSAGDVVSTSGDGPAAVSMNQKLPPFMVFHGQADSLFPVQHARDFVQTFKKVVSSSSSSSNPNNPVIYYLEFPSANNFYDRFSTPRAHYMCYGVERFLDR